MKTVSWILLALVAALLVLGSLGSLSVAYFSDPSADVLAGRANLGDLGLDPAIVTALQGRRGTAAALGMAFGTLLLLVVLGPYRQGERWAWWSILCSMLVFACVTALRVPTLGIWLGVPVALILTGVVFVGLILDLKRLSEPRR